MSKYEDREAREGQILPWLENREIPQENYWNLASSDKALLHNSVCTPIRPTTYNQCRDLYWKLCLPGTVAGTSDNSSTRYPIDPVSFMPVHTLVRPTSKLYEAYQYDSPVKCYKFFKVDANVKRLPAESKGFGRGKTRHVISLAFPDR